VLARGFAVRAGVLDGGVGEAVFVDDGLVGPADVADGADAESFVARQAGSSGFSQRVGGWCWCWCWCWLASIGVEELLVLRWVGPAPSRSKVSGQVPSQTIQRPFQR